MKLFLIVVIFQIFPSNLILFRRQNKSSSFQTQNRVEALKLQESRPILNQSQKKSTFNLKRLRLKMICQLIHITKKTQNLAKLSFKIKKKLVFVESYSSNNLNFHSLLLSTQKSSIKLFQNILFFVFIFQNYIIKYEFEKE